MASSRVTEFAPAKINLTLRVLGRRSDGYHALESLVAFATLGDRLSFAPARELALKVHGPMAAHAGELSNNLVLKAARAVAERVQPMQLGAFELEKHIPVAAGLGGGSADAAAALRLLAGANGLTLDDHRLRAAARATGADVLVCLDPRPRIMRGVGDVLSEPLALPPLPAVLINCGARLATRDVFAALSAPLIEGDVVPALSPPSRLDAGAFIDFLRASGNDLQPVAIKIVPPIADVVAALAAAPSCHLARMSGSGATCFGLYRTARDAASAAQVIAAEHPDWWVRETVFQ